ncbi:MAG: hypothetical protein ACKV2Q_27845 [Planctomycetaceae bacterium]
MRIKLATAPEVVLPVTPVPDPNGEKATVAPPVATASGKFFGRVIFKGVAPSARVMFEKGKAPKESDVCSASGPIMVEDLLVGKDNGIANVFIYLDKPPAGFKVTPRAGAVIFDQKNCTFLTHALVIQVGQPLKIINDDGYPHNTKNSPTKNDPMGATIGANDRTGATVVYKKAESAPVAVKCDFHAWMSAYHLPIDHPFGVVTDKDGNFEIENLPPGDHLFKIWHEKAGFLDKKYKVSVKADMKSIDISADAAKFGLK